MQWRIPWKLLKILSEVLRMTHSSTFYCLSLISDIANCITSSLSLHVRDVLKSQYLFVVSVKPFPANQNVKFECFHCDFQIFPNVFRVYIALFCPKETRLRLTSLYRMQFVLKMRGSNRLVRELLCCDTIYRSYICITEYHFVVENQLCF